MMERSEKYMSSPILSPDGFWMWTGTEWIPAPPKEPAYQQPLQEIVTYPIFDNPFQTLPMYNNLQQDMITFPAKKQKGFGFWVIIPIISVTLLLIVATVAYSLIGEKGITGDQSKSVLIEYHVLCTCDKVNLDIENPDGSSHSWTETLPEDGKWTYAVNVTLYPGDSVYVSMMTQDRDSDWDQEQYLAAIIGANNIVVDSGSEQDSIATVYVLGLVTYETHGDWYEGDD
jgi:hypothetical protein